MKQIFILTACIKNAKEHYKDTIENLVDYNELYRAGIINKRLYDYTKKSLLNFHWVKQEHGAISLLKRVMNILISLRKAMNN